jgi:hypothetical protein
MDLIIYIIIVGMGVAYTTELLVSLLERVVRKKIVKLIFTLPLSFLGIFLLYHLDFVLPFASSFVALALMLLLDKPITVTTPSPRERRYY